MGCININGFEELDFDRTLFGSEMLGYISKDAKEQSITIDVMDIVSYEKAPLLTVDPADKKSASNIETEGLRLLLMSGETFVAPKYSFDKFEKTVIEARKPNTICVTAQSIPLIKISQTITES